MVIALVFTGCNLAGCALIGCNFVPVLGGFVEPMLVVDGQPMTLTEYNNVWRPGYNTKQKAFYKAIVDYAQGRANYNAYLARMRYLAYIRQIANGNNANHERPRVRDLQINHINNKVSPPCEP